LSETGTYAFPEVIAGYEAPGAKTVTVTNTGNQPTGALTVGLSGANAAGFTVSTTDLGSIAVDGSGSFAVAPNTGLAAGTYTATVTVNGGNDINKSFEVSFRVTNAPVYAISLDTTGTHTFSGAPLGYVTPPVKTVTVTNTGNQATGALNIGLSGANATGFTVSPSGLDSIATGGKNSFTVAPNAGLAEGTYTAAIAVSGTNIADKSFQVSFTVSSVLHTVTFNADGGRPATSTAQTYGGTVSLPTTAPVKTGYTFAGWYTAVNGGGTEFTASTPVAAGITVYARWLSVNANLAAISVDAGLLDQTFSPATTTYTITVPNTTSSITVTAIVADTGKASIAQSPAGNPVALASGTNTIRVRVTAENGATKDYRITVTRTPLSANADLSSLEVNTGTLSPVFSAATTAYTVLVPGGITSIIVTAAAADTGKATLAPSSPHTAPLSSASTPVTLRVTAEDGTTKDYVITVNTTTAANAVNVAITRADEHIDLTRSTENDLSQEAGDVLRLTAPAGYANYTWRLDGNSSNYNPISQNVIELYANSYDYGTHSVLLEYEVDGIPYGCEILFRVAR
jgi:uncharacterized repeat protein (TIGR02543 family)